MKCTQDTPDPQDTLLSSSVTIRQYKRLLEKKNVDGIADLIYERFYERYIKPFEGNENRHGFSMMAVSCFMIETLYSFREGCCDTEGKGKIAFQSFFSESVYLFEFKDDPSNGPSNDPPKKFYRNIRCGILHQAETKGGWKIRRRGRLLNLGKKTINADKFLNALHNELKSYVSLLKKDTIESGALYRNAVKKLNYICDNCKAKENGEQNGTKKSH